MKMPGMESAYGSKAVCAVFFAFFFLTFAFDAYSIDPTNKLDFDGDGKADIAVYREGTSNDRVSSQAYSGSTFWYWRSSDGAWHGEPFGRTLDVPVPADYTGTSSTDPAIFRWFEPDAAPYDTNAIWILGAGNRGFGNPFGRKMGRNFDSVYGGSKAELGEFQHVNIYYDTDEPPFYQYKFYWQTSATNLDYIVTNVPSGQSASSYNQVPVPEDYKNNDGKSEIAVFNTNTGCYHVWLGSQSAPVTNPLPPCFGSGYTASPGEYDRDGWVDYGVFKSTGSNSFEWKFVSSQNGGATTTFSMTTSVNGTGKPVVADYDGDGVADYAVAQSSGGVWNWTIRKSGCPSNINSSCNPSTTTAVFGLISDTLLASPYFNDPWY